MIITIIALTMSILKTVYKHVKLSTIKCLTARLVMIIITILHDYCLSRLLLVVKTVRYPLLAKKIIIMISRQNQLIVIPKVYSIYRFIITISNITYEEQGQLNQLSIGGQA